MTQEIEAGVLRVSSAAAVLAIDDLRLLGVQLQADSSEPGRDGSPQSPGLILSVTVGNAVIRVALKRAARELPSYPRIERIVGSPRGFSPRGSHGTERDTLASFRSSHPVHRYARIHAQ